MTVAEILDPEVEKKINELKKRVGSEMKPSMREDNNLLHKFLIARDYNLNQAEAMIRKHLQWRKENQVDNILNEEYTERYKELISYMSENLLGFDKEGCPVKYFSVGSTDWKGFRQAEKWPVRYRYMVRLMEEEKALVEAQSKKLGKNIKGMVYIADFKNFPFSMASDKRFISEFMNVISMAQDNYPEKLKLFLVINVSNYVTWAFQIVKVVIAASILSKMKMFGGPEEYEPHLLKVMDPEDLPAFLGGKKTDPDGDPACKTFINYGGPIPAKFFTNKTKSTLSKNKDAKKLVVPRASFSEIELKVEEANSVIEWEFETKTRDIGFGVFFKEEGEEDKVTELVPLTRLETDDFTETGMFNCEKPGTYILLFDNSYSWMRSKEIYYKASVVSEKDSKKELAL